MNNKGFTLVEIMIVVAVICLLSVMAIPSYAKARNRAYYAKTAADMRIFQLAIQEFCQYEGEYPETLESLLDAPVGSDWAYINMIPTDWFGYNYEYQNLEGIAYKLRSVGEDGVAGSGDDIEVW